MNLAPYLVHNYLHEGSIVKLTGSYAVKTGSPSIPNNTPTNNTAAVKQALQQCMVEVELLEPDGKVQVVKITQWVKFSDLYLIHKGDDSGSV